MKKYSFSKATIFGAVIKIIKKKIAEISLHNTENNIAFDLSIIHPLYSRKSTGTNMIDFTRNKLLSLFV